MPTASPKPTPEKPTRVLSTGTQVGRLFDKLVANDQARQAALASSPDEINARHDAKQKALLEAAEPSVAVLALDAFERSLETTTDE